jgi:hypothetical protein
MHHEGGAGKAALPVPRRDVYRAQNKGWSRPDCRSTTTAMEGISVTPEGFLSFRVTPHNARTRARVLDATVKPEIREVVETTRHLLAEGRDEVHQADLKAPLKLDKSAISRRVAGAIDGGFLKNLEDRKGRPARLVLGDPLPDNHIAS